MLRNYLTVAFRNLTRNSIYSFINIGGLAVGIACSVLIFLWVWDEITYDRFHKNADRLGILVTQNVYSDKVLSRTSVPLPAYEFLKTYDNRIKNTCISHEGGDQLLKVGDKVIYREGKFVSHEFLSMFRFPLLRGSVEDVLREPNSIVLTEAVAKELFGLHDPMGQLIQLDNAYEMKVTGVLKDLPLNSSFTFDFLFPWSAVVAHDPEYIEENSNWENEAFQVYLELQDGADVQDLNSSLTKLIREKRGNESKSEIVIIPLLDWRLRSNFENGRQTGGKMDYVKSFALVGLFILIIACINFMNLATARSERRAREVGIRKTIGSGRKDLIGQFLGEAIVITALAFLVSLLLIQLSLPFFNSLVDKQLFIDYSSPVVWILFVGFILLVGTFSGSYPAFYLSSFNPVKVLKGNLHVGRSNAVPRKLLVSSQFLFSIFLIVGMMVVFMQIQYVKNRDVGYDRENLVMLNANGEMAKNLPEIERQLLASGIAKSITTSASPVTDIYRNAVLDWPGRQDGLDISFSNVVTGYHYARTLGINVIEGRDFSEEFKSDSNAMLLNKAAVEVMGVENPVGMQVQIVPYKMKWTVVGVIDDVVMSSPFTKVQPGFFRLIPRWFETVTIRLEKTNDLKETISRMRAIFKNLNPSYPFEYHFVDDEFAKKFSEINMIGVLVSLFAVLAVFITCLGLLGLAAFTAEQRTKEIGIRKIMGATTASIVGLLSKDFTRLVAMGFILAAPVSWWVLNDYLERYTYRIIFSWWIIPAAGAAVLLLALMIVSTQAIKVAKGNPVESLRSE
jgi:putative ABC transport system permease protein